MIEPPFQKRVVTSRTGEPDLASRSGGSSQLFRRFHPLRPIYIPLYQCISLPSICQVGLWSRGATEMVQQRQPQHHGGRGGGCATHLWWQRAHRRAGSCAPPPAYHNRPAAGDKPHALRETTILWRTPDRR